MTAKLLTNVSIAFVYKKATYGSETISQTHLAETLEILEEQDDWVRVRQEDQYEGWVSRSFLVEKPDHWTDHETYYPADQLNWIYQSPDRNSTTVRDMTILSGLPVLKRQPGWIQVLLPDGQSGWMENHPRQLVNSVDIEQLIQTAFGFLGIQYFWGGRSPKGFDCSGFTQTCFALNGLQLPRDAYLQAEKGTLIEGDYKSWQVGDLLFFSERPGHITHVAISLGDGDFIHASGFVKLNSLNPQHQELFIKRYAGIFTKATRIL
ncbi:MAG: SH3 domain-containing C40 family peptidase [Candidatus Marinimicrobia bacterium]|nr:SH3 domain-containing C40 family peptidase [Candidatus Neomarinimicrobiota bacterium]